MVELTDGKSRIFVCWLYAEDVQEGETKSEAVDRLILAAGYEGRNDYFDFWVTRKGGALKQA